MSCPGRVILCLLFNYWGHVVTSIREVMPMINNILTILAFVGFVFEKVVNGNILPRLLGV